jgi:Na+(H+)/acetate symporter ActP
VAFIVTWVVSLMTAPPSKEMQESVDSIRTPKGELAWAKGQTHE